MRKLIDINEKSSAWAFGEKLAEGIFSRVMISKPEVKPKPGPLVSSIAQQFADKIVPVNRKPGNSTNPPPGAWKTK